MKRALLCLLLPASLGAGGLPLPPAPVRVVIPDPSAFEAALSGGYRDIFNGAPKPDDRALAAWRQSQVGSKLEDQWLRLSKDLPWTWDDIRALHPSAVGLSLLQVGHLEAVLVVDSPLAQLPTPLPSGTPETYNGVSYALVTKGAADSMKNPNRRMGLAWARTSGHLILATSERAMKLALDELQAGRGFEAPLSGLVSMDLDLDALRKDRYFKREFLFAAGPEQGHVKAALRAENGHLVEVRCGTGDARPDALVFDAAGAAAAGWEPDGGFWPAFRRGLLEPIPAPSDLPVPALVPLPSVGGGADDHYGVDFTRPMPKAGGAGFEEGDLAAWKTLLAQSPVPAWGYWIGKDGARRMAIPWPAAKDAAFVEACRASVERRAGRAVIVDAEGAKEIRVGPGLPALALKREGAVLWAASSAKELAHAPAPVAQAGLLRWANLDLDAVRAEAPRWEKAEGPAQPETVRPLSDRVLGLLGWMPRTHGLKVERKRDANGWTETVVFESGE
ncbi:MAG: hypothetical protein JST05_07705 [Acidobacteria bacterium]|nr:hypothetical protein [Acidobacteriota bacterium]